MIRPGLHHQGIPQTFLTQQHGQSTPSQPHNLNLLPTANQSMNFLQNPHSPNGPFPPNPQLARIQSDSRRRDIQSQSQRATAGGVQTPSVVNGILPGHPSGVGYSGIVPQNGQVPAHRVVSQPVGVGGPLTPSHPSSHPSGISNPGLGLNGGLQTQRSVSQPQPQPQMGPRPGQPPLPGQPNVGQIRQPPVGMPGAPSGTGVRGSAGMAVNMAPGMIGNVPQQTPQQGFSSPLGMGPQLPPQGPQGPATSMSQPMHRTISTPEGANSFGGMPGFAGGPFSQSGSHPPASHIAGQHSANQFSFMPPSSSPSQHLDMHGLSSGGAGPSSTSPTRSDFTVTPAQVASLQYGPGAHPGSSGSGTNETFHPTFTTMPPQPPQRPSSSSQPALGLAPQHAPTAQGLSHPTPPRQQTPLQSQLSQAQMSERLNNPIPNPTRPQSQPQRPSSQQQARQSSTPRMPPGTLPPNATLLQGHRPANITGASAPPPQPRPIMGSVVTGPPPLTSTSSTENGDMSRQPGVPGIRASMPRFVCSIWRCQVCISHPVVVP